MVLIVMLVGVTLRPVLVASWRSPDRRQRLYRTRLFAGESGDEIDSEEDAEIRIQRLEAASKGRGFSPPPEMDTEVVSKPTRAVWKEGELLPEGWEDLSLGEKAWEIYAGERGALYWANRFALAAAIFIGVAWILFRFVGPSLGLYELKSTFNS